MDVKPSESHAQLVQHANVAQSPAAPFFAFPSWWRRFIFRVLAPREVVTYLYVCSLVGREGIAYPTQAQIAQEIGVSSLDTVAKALKKITWCGLLIRNMQRFGGFTRPVYQRPAPEFTLIRLLDIKVIDNELFPFDRSQDFSEDLDTADQAVKLGLRTLLGDERFAAYANGRNQLRGLLDSRFVQRSAMSFNEAWAALERSDVYDFGFTSAVTVRFVDQQVDQGVKRIKTMLEHGIDIFSEAARMEVAQPVPAAEGRTIIPIRFSTQRPLNLHEAISMAALTIRYLREHIHQIKFALEVVEDVTPAVASSGIMPL